MKLLHNIKLTYSIALLAIAPMIVAIIISAILVTKEQRTVSEMKLLTRAVELSVAMGDLVNDVQTERGVTAIFLTTVSTEYQTKVAYERGLTNASREAFLEMAATFDSGILGDELMDGLTTLTAMATNLNTLRNSVDSRSINASDAAKTYTAFIESMLAYIPPLAETSTDAGISRSIQSYYNMMLVKEYTGRERAVGAAGFAAGRFSTKQLTSLDELSGAQNALSFVALETMSRQEHDLFMQVTRGGDSTEVTRMRTIVDESGGQGFLQNITVTQWFDVITRKIVGFYEVEKMIAQNLITASDFKGEDVQVRLRNTIIAVTLSLSLMALISIMIIMFVSRSFRNLVGSAQELAIGNLDVELPPKTKSEFGQLSQSLTVFRDNARDRIAAEQEETNARKAREEEAAMRTAEMDRLSEEVLKTVNAARDGDFKQLVSTNFTINEFLTLGQSLNKLVDTVDTGLTEVGHSVRALATGNLNRRVEGEYFGSFKTLQDSVNETIDQLRNLVRDLKSTSNNVYNSITEISEGSTSLSARAESQAASLEQTAAAMEEMAATVKANAGNSATATQLTKETNEQAEHGRSVVARTVDAMNNIRASSKEIGSIVGIIESIAFQTNLLALNAAVEAARAGDAGKGFAVVASEVRTLAQRSSEAASTIKELIVQSTEYVENGDKLVGETDTSLGVIIESIQKVSHSIQEIANAGNEQTVGVDEVSGAVCQMDELTQQNAAMADNSAIAARSLAEQSKTLIKLVGFFSDDGQSSAAVVGQETKGERLQAWDNDAHADVSQSKDTSPFTEPEQATANGTWTEF